MNNKLKGNRNKQKGIAFERRVKKDLTNKGYFVVRQAASLFPDLIVVKEGEVFAVECKTNGYLSRSEKTELFQLEADYHLCPVLASRSPKTGHILYEEFDYLTGKKKKRKGI